MVLHAEPVHLASSRAPGQPACRAIRVSTQTRQPERTVVFHATPTQSAWQGHRASAVRLKMVPWRTTAARRVSVHAAHTTRRCSRKTRCSVLASTIAPLHSVRRPLLSVSLAASSLAWTVKPRLRGSTKAGRQQALMMLRRPAIGFCLSARWQRRASTMATINAEQATRVSFAMYAKRALGSRTRSASPVVWWTDRP